MVCSPERNREKLCCQCWTRTQSGWWDSRHERTTSAIHEQEFTKDCTNGLRFQSEEFKKTVGFAAVICMRYQKFFSIQSFITANFILAVSLGCLRSEAAGENPAPAEITAPNSRLLELIDAAKYSAKDKEVLKAGLSIAIAGATTHDAIVGHVSQETIDIQVKKTQGDYASTLVFISNVSQCLEEKSAEFIKTETFQRIPAADRDVVAAYFAEVTEYYHARALETLFAHHERNISIPAEVPRSITNAEYRNLLYLVAKASPKKNWVRLTPGQKSYVLQKGDSLAFVARKHNVSPQAIITANPGLNPTRMQPGQILVIPSIAGVTATVPALTKETALSSTR